MKSARTMLDGNLSDEKAVTAVNRTDMIEAARKFMLAPKVRQTPYEEQKQFLIGKGLTEREIEEARRTLPPSQLMPLPFTCDRASTSSLPGFYAEPQQPTQNRLMQLVNSVIVVGSISYAGYRFVRSVILPKFFDVPDPAVEEQRQLQMQVNELQNSIKFVMDSVNQTLQAVNHQNEQISRALLLRPFDGNGGTEELHRLQTDVSIIKSLLLNQDQFAAVPSRKTAPLISDGVPAWQRPKNASENIHKDDIANGYQTPPTDASVACEDLLGDGEVEQVPKTCSGSSV